MNQTEARMYQSGSQTSMPLSLPGGSPSGSSQNASRAGLNGCSPSVSAAQPAASMAGTAISPTSPSGGSSRRSREVTTLPAARLSSEAAVSDPAKANMMPMAGSTM